MFIRNYTNKRNVILSYSDMGWFHNGILSHSFMSKEFITLSKNIAHINRLENQFINILCFNIDRYDQISEIVTIIVHCVYTQYSATLRRVNTTESQLYSRRPTVGSLTDVHYISNIDFTMRNAS